MLKNSMIIYVISTNVMYLPTHNIGYDWQGELNIGRTLIESTSHKTWFDTQTKFCVM